ncbi:MAG TPA: purine-nucleoside phosphorylase, partial [Myxococcota bacterium]|nr:purine-nucleoside phosphorylase [Myxococcota bacterium]
MVDGIVRALRERVGEAPRLVVVLGSGLGPLAARVGDPVKVSYSDLGLPQPKVQGHAGELIVGDLGGARVGLLCGRVHLYEGWHPWEVVRGVRAMHAWGVGVMLLTASVGSIHVELGPGNLVGVSDFVSFQAASPLVGPPWA